MPENEKSALERLRTVHLKSWASQREDVLSKKKEWRDGWERRLCGRWGTALDEYETVVEAALRMWWEFNKRWAHSARATDDHKTIALIELNARCLRISQEVLALLRSGFAAGAARARTMHELAVVAFYVKDNCAEAAQRYREHSVVERYRHAVEYNRTLPVTHAHRGYEPIDEDTLEALAEQRDRLRDKYGVDFLNLPYGWAAVALGKARPTFRDLEESVGMAHNRPFYAWSSQDIHPGSHGNNLSYLKRGNGTFTLAAGPSNLGLADPAASALIALHQTAVALCLPLAEREFPEESCLVTEVYAYRIAEIEALSDIVEKAQLTFLEADRKLAEDERCIWQEFPTD